MEQRALVEPRRRILDHQRAGRERAEQIGLAERARRDAPRAGDLGPDRRQMALARAFRPDQRSARSGQSGQRSISASAAAFGRAGEEILAREALRVRQRERQLTRNIHGMRVRLRARAPR